MTDVSSLDFQHQLLDLAESLKPLPSTVVQLIAIASDGNSSIDDVEELLREDLALAAAILSEANSAMSGSAAEITTVRGAVMRLGLSRVTTIAAGSAMSDSEAVRPLDSYGLRRGELLRHSQITSYVAEVIHGLAPQVVSSEAVAAALFHDLGQLVLNKVLDPVHFGQARQACELVTEAERELVDVDHAEIGAFLLGMWGIPHKICEAVRFHHEPSKSPGKLAHSVNVANQVASYLDHGPRVDASSPHQDQQQVLADAALGELETRTQESVASLGVNLDDVIERSTTVLNRHGFRAGNPQVSADQDG